MSAIWRLFKLSIDWLIDSLAYGTCMTMAVLPYKNTNICAIYLQTNKMCIQTKTNWISKTELKQIARITKTESEIRNQFGNL